MGRRKRPSVKKVEDAVVAEHSIILLPVHKKVHTSAATINRVQFQQKRYWLRSMSRFPSQCFVSYKQNVKQLRFGFISEDSSTTANDGKIDDLKNCEVYSGEGFSQPERANYALGFAKNDKLFLLPIDQNYEMHWTNRSTQTDSEKSHEALSAPNTSNNEPTLPITMSPVRIRFARIETDNQKRRREQSALYKQRLVDQDPWLPLYVQQNEISSMYEKEIGRLEKTTELPTYAKKLRWKVD